MILFITGYSLLSLIWSKTNFTQLHKHFHTKYKKARRFWDVELGILRMSCRERTMRAIKGRKMSNFARVIRNNKYKPLQLIIQNKIAGKLYVGRRWHSWLGNLRQWVRLQYQLKNHVSLEQRPLKSGSPWCCPIPYKRGTQKWWRTNSTTNVTT